METMVVKMGLQGRVCLKVHCEHSRTDVLLFIYFLEDRDAAMHY